MMDIKYDKAALQEYMGDIENVGESVRRVKDESFLLYNSCRQQYTRLYTELEQANRKAYNMVESAESMQRVAEAEYEFAMRRLESVEDDSERESVLRQLRNARAQRAEAAHEVSVALDEYDKAQANMQKLTDVWERYQPLINSAAHKAEDGVSSFGTLVGNGNRDLGEYMESMDKAQAALQDGGSLTSSSGGTTGFRASSPSGRESVPSSHAFRSKVGNTIGVVSVNGVTSIVINVAGEKQTYPHTKSGAAKVYRAAVKSGDDELASQANLLFTSYGTRSIPVTPNQQYVAETMDVLKIGLPDTIDKEMVLAGAEVRKMRVPKTEMSAGELKGTWKNSVFYMDDNFVPKYKNQEKLTVAEIKRHLSEFYGIQVDGIPFTNGVADFSDISVATVSTKDIVMKSKGMTEWEYDSMEPLEKTKTLSEVFAKNRREPNFALADKIVVERQISIPGLEPGYTEKELAEWRRGKFTWDEQVNGGYNLVPTIIHGNISHTGLVSSSEKAVQYFEKRKKDSPMKYNWNEEDAPISIGGFLDKKK